MQPSLRSLDLVPRGQWALLDQFRNFDWPVCGTSGVSSALSMADPRLTHHDCLLHTPLIGVC